MQTTLESTFQLQAAIDWCMPSRHQGELNALLDRLDRLEAKPIEQTKLMRAVKITRAQAKDHDLQAAVALVLEIKAKPLTKMGWKDRASYIQGQLVQAPTAWGLPVDYNERERDIRLIRAALHEWENITGCSGKSVPPAP